MNELINYEAVCRAAPGFGWVFLRVPDQEGRTAGQRQYGAEAGKRFLVLFRIIEQDQELVQHS